MHCTDDVVERQRSEVLQTDARPHATERRRHGVRRTLLHIGHLVDEELLEHFDADG